MTGLHRTFLSVCCGIGLALALFSSRSEAAEVRESSLSYCDLELVGQIVPGDFARVQAAVEPMLEQGWANPDSGEAKNRPFCLHSEGGSLGEAVRIAEYFFEHGVGTVLPENGVCLSACAWIFMMGSFRGWEDALLNRKMHFTARLGFHAPSLDLGSEKIIPKSTVDQAMAIMTEATAVLLKLSNENTGGTRPYIDMDLIQRAFSNQGSEKFFYINRVDHAGRWRIDVFGFDYPDRLDVQGATHACNNLGRWPRKLTLDSSLDDDSSDWINSLMESNRRKNEVLQVNRFEVLGVDNGYFVHDCMIAREIFQAEYELYSIAPEIKICGENQLTGIQWGQSQNCRQSSEDSIYARATALSIFSPETLLVDLPTASARLKEAAGRIGTVVGNSSSLSCWLTEPSARITNVNEYVNLRRQPDFTSPVIRQVPLGESVQIKNPGNIVAIGKNRVRQSCINNCQASEVNREDGDRVRKCIDDNILWYEIMDGRGNRGWVSRKFLAEVE